MKKWLACLKDQRGTAFPLVIAVTLACLLILCGIFPSEPDCLRGEGSPAGCSGCGGK